MGNKASTNNEEGQEKRGMIKGAKQGYNELVNAIIRPPRAEYTLAMLGPKRFSIRGKRYIREDITLTNKRGMKIVGSHWLPENLKDQIPCVVYLHGNSSCRLEALDCLNTLLSQGLSLFSFDFCGSGKSDGDYISLGWYERDDVAVVVEHLRASDHVSTIGLWGRSMGASTALMYAERDHSLACVILDSPFASLPQLARELVESAQLQVPKFAVNLALRLIRSSVKTRAKFDINKIQPINFCEASYIPALFGAAEDDSFINPSHSRQLHDKYAGDKNIVLFSGTHNTKREKYFHTSAAIFLHETLVKPSGMVKNSMTGAEHEGAMEIGEEVGDFMHYDVPNPLATHGNRSTLVTDTDISLLKTGFVDEEEAQLQKALELSLSEYEKSQQKD